MSEADASASDDLPPPTAPANFGVSVRAAFDTEERARAFANRVGLFAHAISRHINLNALDGITVAGDYSQALLDLDRGYPTNHRLEPSDGYAVGVAMTAHVLREEQLKSHIVLNAGYVCGLEVDGHEHFPLGLHILAHECAHVAVTAAFDRAFPNFILRKSHTNLRHAFRWQVILACWDEYAATNISAPYGEDPTDGYEETFLKSLSVTRAEANTAIKNYRLHGDVERIMGEVYGLYGNLLKFAAYHLGNLAGRGVDVAEREKTVAALHEHWFAPYFERLKSLCETIADDFDGWTSLEPFEAVGDLIDELVAEGGVHVSDMPDDGVYADIPFTPETMPD